MRLTGASVAGLVLPKDRAEAIFFDDVLKGFGLRLRRGGSRVWIVQFQLHGHKQRRITIGPASVFSADEARKIAKQHLAAAHLGRDPAVEKAAERAAARLTLSTVIDRYRVAKAGKRRARTMVELERYLKAWWRPLHAVPLHKVTRKDIAVHLVGPPTAAARARFMLSALYAWAMQQGLASENPVIGTANPAEDIKPRERTLDDRELAAVWRAAGDDNYGRIIRLLILTGCRRQEVGSMAWDELDPEAGTWRIPSERSKNGRELVLPLPPAAWSIIETTPRMGLLLFIRRGRDYGNWAAGKCALDARAQIAPWRLHDLRRSFATGLSELGTPPHIVEATLNHGTFRRGVAATYNRATYEREVRAALALWADHVRSIVEDGERKIVPLRG